MPWNGRSEPRSGSTTVGNEQIDAGFSGLASAFTPALGHLLLNDQPKRAAIVFLAVSLADVFIFAVSFILTFLIIGIFEFS